MSDEFWIFLIFCGGSASFIAGVLFHKYVISEATAIKEHVSDEIDNVRVSLEEHVAAVRKEISSALSKAAEKV